MILFEEQVLMVCETQVLWFASDLSNDESNLFTFLIIAFQTNKLLKSNCHHKWPIVVQSAVLYLHNICDPKVGGTFQYNMMMFKKLCRPDPLKNVIADPALPHTDFPKKEIKHT